MSQLILQPFRRFTYATAHFPTLPLLALLILQPLSHFTYVTAHSSTLSSLYLRHSVFSNPSVASSANFSNLSVTSHTSQLILQPFRRFTYATAHSPTFPLLALLILQPFGHFTYVTAHFPTIPSLYLRHSAFSNPSVASSAHSPTFPPLPVRHSPFSNPSVASPTSQLILQSFRCFTYVTAHSPTFFFASTTSQALHLRHLASCPCPGTILTQRSEE